MFEKKRWLEFENMRSEARLCVDAPTPESIDLSTTRVSILFQIPHTEHGQHSVAFCFMFEITRACPQHGY